MPKSPRYRKQLEAAFINQFGLCWICNLPMLSPQCTSDNSYNPLMATLDHLKPRRQNHNVVAAAHAKCNHIRQHNSLNSSKMIEHIAWMHLHFDD